MRTYYLIPTTGYNGSSRGYYAYLKHFPFDIEIKGRWNRIGADSKEDLIFAIKHLEGNRSFILQHRNAYDEILKSDVIGPSST